MNVEHRQVLSPLAVKGAKSPHSLSTVSSFVPRKTYPITKLEYLFGLMLEDCLCFRMTVRTV